MISSVNFSSAFRCRRALRLLAAILSAGSVVAQPAPTAIIAHRGGSKLAPENTCAAIRAGDGSADRVEFDVRTSADGQLVLMHDETVDRTTDGTGAVSNLTLVQLKALDAGSKFSPAFAGERIPTLAEALRAQPPGLPPLRDCKVAAPRAIVDVLRAENALDDVVVAYGSWDFLFEVGRLEARIALCAAGSGELATNTLAMLQSYGVHAVAWDQAFVTPEILARVHARGMRLFVAAEAAEIQAFLDMGVDGLYTDDPRAARRLLAPRASIALGLPPRDLPVRGGLGEELVAHWKLDEGLADPFAANAEEATGRSRGRLVGFASSPGWVSGADALAGGALRLDGRDDYVRIPPNDFLDIGANAVSLSLWVKLSVLPSRLPGDYSFIYGSDLASYSLYLDRNRGELQFRVTDANGHFASPGIPEAALQTDVWHHVAGVYDGAAAPGVGQVSIYLDGQLQDTHVGDDASPGLGLTQAVLPGQFAALGRRGDQDEFYFSGILDDVALWRRALSPAEIVLIHASGSEHVPLDRIKDVR